MFNSLKHKLFNTFMLRFKEYEVHIMIGGVGLSLIGVFEA